MIEQGETAEAAFDAVDGTIDSMTTTTIFSHCKPNPCGEAAEEQRHTDDNFICSRRRNLRRQHAGVFGGCACGGIPPRLLHPACITGPQPHGRASKARLGSLGTPDWTWRHACFIIVD